MRLFQLGYLLVACIAEVIGAAAQTLEKEQICPAVEAVAPSDAEFCIANRSPNPTDGSVVIVSRSSAEQNVLLIRLDQPRGGNCAPTFGISRAYQCVTLTFETPPDYDAICNFRSPYFWRCDGGPLGKYYNVASNMVPPGPGGVHPVSTERFYAAARGLKTDDHSVEELRGALVYRHRPDPSHVSLRVVRGADLTPSLIVRTEAAERTSLGPTLDRILSAGVALADVRGLGMEGRFTSESTGVLHFHGTASDCEGQCLIRPLLTQTEFENRLSVLNARVVVERLSGADLVKLRQMMTERLLMGEMPLRDVDRVLETARIRQPPAFLVLDWR